MTKNSVSVLLTGSEVLDGRVQDTNANFIASQLANRGLKLAHFLACDDSIEDIERCLSFLSAESKYVIISGGIGPTSDDLTRESVAQFLGRNLVLDESILTPLKKRYEERKRTFHPSNTKQALFPEGATVIPNTRGTAAGFFADHRTNDLKTRFCIVPGVPYEMEKMFIDSILPEIVAELGTGAVVSKLGFRVFGIAESVVGASIKALGIPSSIFVSYRAAFPEIHVLLKTEGDPGALIDWHTKAVDAVGADAVYTQNFEKPLDEVVSDLLKEKNISVAVAESCTSGGIGQALGRYAGASAFLRGGAIVYTPEAKIRQLGVAAQTIETHEIVSREVAVEMAKGVREKFSSSIAVSITGALGPTGGTQRSPIGTFYIGLDSEQKSRGYHFFMPLARAQLNTYAVWSALDVIRRTLLNFPIIEHSYDGK